MSTNKMTVVDRNINELPQELLDRLQKLKPGEIKKIRLNPMLSRTVTTISGDSLDPDKPKHSGTTKKFGTHFLTNNWNVNYQGRLYHVGYLSRFDSNGEPFWERFQFNKRGELSLNGDNPVHAMVFMYLQLSPDYRYNILEVNEEKKERHKWKCEIVDVLKDNQTIVLDAKYRHEIETKIWNLTDQQAMMLMQHSLYGIGLYNKPELVSDPESARAFIIGECVRKPGGIGLREAEGKLNALERIINIGTIHDALASKDWELIENTLKSKLTGAEIMTFPSQVQWASAAEWAAYIFTNYGKNEGLLKAIDDIREAKRATKKSAGKA